MKALVAFFSASGVTKRVAKTLSEAINADLFEIEPETKYTDADLNWMDSRSRSSLEMKDISSRPAIKSKTDVAPYDVVFVGFPIWWYREPSIIDTFIEQYDFDGKVIVPFATSGGPGLGDTADNLRELAPKAIVKEGKRLRVSADRAELRDWASEAVK